MVWQIEFDPEALKDLHKLDRPIQIRLVGFLRTRISVMKNPRALGEALSGQRLGSYWKYRVGDWRIICDIQDQRIVVRVLRIGNRREFTADPSESLMPHAHQLTRKQWVTLVILTLVWGINWPILKVGVTGYPAITFRSLSMWIGWPLLGLVLLKMKVPFKIPRNEWKDLMLLASSNMFVWHVLMILAVQDLSSGRAAILGYTMPIFSAVIGMFFFKSPLRARAWLGVALAAVGAMLLLWHELTDLSGKPLGVVMALVAAAAWALGTQQIRHTQMSVPTLTIVFWMTGMTAVVMTGVAACVEIDRWAMPSVPTWGAIVYNAIGVFVFAQAAWLGLARSLPPLASSLSVMFIPVLGVFTGAWWLGEVLHWQDWLAVLLVVAAIASVLWPTRTSDA